MLYVFPPTFIESIKINFSFSKTDTEVDSEPKSIQMAPNNLSSLFRVARAEDKGEGIKFSIWMFRRFKYCSNSFNEIYPLLANL